MPFIDVVEPEDAGPELAAVYADIRKSRGKIASVHKIQSLNPPTIPAHMDLYMATMFSRSPLSRAEREMMAVVVSAANGCRYCVAHHGEALLRFWKDRKRIDALAADVGTGRFEAPKDPDGLADLSLRERALCRYAYRVTVQPGSGEDGSAVDELRSTVSGATDREILDATLVTGYFNFVNRIVLTLGVELESDPGGYRYEER